MAMSLAEIETMIREASPARGRRAEGPGRRLRRFQGRIAQTRAQTTAGLLAKLAVVAAWNLYGDGGVEGGTADDILRSMAVDFMALKPALAAV
jgi:hypothetical protein